MKRKRLTSSLPRCEQISWSDLEPSALRTLISLARREDLSGSGFRRSAAHRGDVTTRSLIAPATAGRARLVARQPMVVCGLPLVPLILDCYGQSTGFRPLRRDGDTVEAGDALGQFSLPAARLLTAERVILNFLQHLSGIATQTARFARLLAESPTRILDTRKTTPGYRALEKYAVARGGGWNHRLGLYDRVMIKDNHLAARDSGTGSALRDAILAARRRNPDLLIEVEVDALDQIPAVMEALPEIILLDNFTPSAIRQAVRLIAGRAAIEASGGITLDSIPAYAHLGLDFISSGALVHQSRWVDIGLDWTPR
ncbi:MAG: carboxylating nicotinate-nucleotide diphosphorylase [Opitutaceae bacterium]